MINVNIKVNFMNIERERETLFSLQLRNISKSNCHHTIVIIQYIYFCITHTLACMCVYIYTHIYTYVTLSVKTRLKSNSKITSINV